MTFPNLGKNEDLINRSILVFAGVLFAFYLPQGKMRVFKEIAFQAPSKVHFVRLIFRSRGKFTLLILEFVQIFSILFLCARDRFLKKKTAAPWAKGPSCQPPAKATRPQGHRARHAQGGAAPGARRQGAAILRGFLVGFIYFRFFFQIFSLFCFLILDLFLILIYFLSPTPSKTLPSPI